MGRLIVKSQYLNLLEPQLPGQGISDADFKDAYIQTVLRNVQAALDCGKFLENGKDSDVRAIPNIEAYSNNSLIYII